MPYGTVVPTGFDTVSDRGPPLALRRHGIPSPPRQPQVDLAPLVRDYAAGVPLDDIASAYGCSRSWVRKKANDAGVRRPRRSVSAHPELADPAALRRLLAEHGSFRQAATAIGTTRRTLREALARHDVTFVPARYLERWRLAVEAERVAKARQRRVIDELRARAADR